MLNVYDLSSYDQHQQFVSAVEDDESTYLGTSRPSILPQQSEDGEEWFDESTGYGLTSKRSLFSFGPISASTSKRSVNFDRKSYQREAVQHEMTTGDMFEFSAIPEEMTPQTPSLHQEILRQEAIREERESIQRFGAIQQLRTANARGDCSQQQALSQIHHQLSS